MFVHEKYGLSPQEKQVVWAVMTRKVVTHMEMAEVLWPNAEDMPDSYENHIRILVFHANRKIRPHGWNIKGTWQRGTRLERYEN